jgi:hypothetical protein
VSGQDRDPDEDDIQDESGTPLPDRDAMSIIGGPQIGLPIEGPAGVESPTLPHSEPTDVKTLPRHDV